MKLKKLLGASSALCLCATVAQAQETNEVEQLKQQLRQMQQRFEQREAEERAQIIALQKQVDLLSQRSLIAPAGTNPVAAAAPTNAVSPGMFEELKAKVDGVVEAQKKSLPGEFNPAIGLVGETLFSYGSGSADQVGSPRPGGFDVFQRSLEFNAMASVDPFAKAWVVANASADAATGEAAWGIEEAALQTTSLPGNLTLTGGRFFGEFGRLANIHDHELPFVNRPLALATYIGGESRTDGAQINWLVPIDHYLSVTAGVGDQFGGDSPNPNNPGNYRSFYGLNFWGRASTSFDLTDNWAAEVGASGLANPRTQDRGGLLMQPDGSALTEKSHRLAGLDFKLTYVPLRDNQFKSFTWGTELLFSDDNYLFSPLAAAAYRGDVNALGLYSYVSYKWSRQWSGGFLFDYLQSAQNHSDVALAYSPFVTFALSHWNQLRLQYTHTDHNAVSGLKPDEAVYLQWTWIIGAHSHGWSQR